MPRSLPALACNWLFTGDSWPRSSASAELLHTPLVPAYAIPDDLTPDDEARQVVNAVSCLCDRLARVQDVYGEWEVFEVGPYFDLYPQQTNALCKVIRLRSTIHIRLYADLMMPSFRRAERYWVESVIPSYYLLASGDSEDSWQGELWRQTTAQMQAYLLAAQNVAERVVCSLFDKGQFNFMTSSAALDERRRQSALRRQQQRSLTPGLSTNLLPPLRDIHSLTLERTISLSPDRKLERAIALMRWRRQRLRTR